MILDKLFKSSKKYNLERYYILKLFGYAIFLHKILKSDDNYHTHPWNGISFIFGSYAEERMGQPVKRKWLFNYVAAKTPHRVFVDKPVWTLFVHGRRCNKWAVYNTDGQMIEEEPWRGISPERTKYGNENTVS